MSYTYADKAKTKQMNLRVSKVDQDKIEMLLAHLNKDKSYYNLTNRTELLLDGLDLLMTKHKLKLSE